MEVQHDGIFDVRKAGMLDSPGRLQELRPDVLLREIAGVREGQTAVDLGSGTGVFALPMAGIAGKDGRVYAVDNSPAMMEHIRAKNPPPNLVPVLADVTSTGLPDAVTDVCLLASILHEVSEPGRLVAEAARLLKPGGRVVVVDYRAEKDSPGPPQHKRISQEHLKRLFEQAGLSFQSYREWTASYYAAIGEKPAPQARVKELEDAIAELKARWPAHSVPPHMWQQLEDLEEQLKRAKQEAIPRE
jgi:ubiquinone/menaquinone biosynthesis C-methylase UbiE